MITRFNKKRNAEIDIIESYKVVENLKQREDILFMSNTAKHNIKVLNKKVLSESEKQQYKQRVKDLRKDVNNNIVVIPKKPFYSFFISNENNDLKHVYRRVV